jgi:Phage-related minor tail protein
MSQNLRTSLIIDLSGNLQGKANQFLTSMQKLSTGGSRSMTALQKSVTAVSAGLDKLGNRYTALLSGAAGVGAIRMVGDLSQRLTYLGITAQASSRDIDGLYANILNVAQSKDIRVDPSGILSGVEVIVEKLGDLKLAEENLRNIGLVMRATGADGKDVGDMIANLKEKFNLKPSEILPALDTMVLQGKAGAFTLKDMVTQGNRVTAAYGAMGRKGPKAVAELGAALQVFRKSSGSSEETSTAFKNFFADLMEPAKRKILKANGIQIWDPEALKRGKKEIRSIVDITDQLLKKSGGDPEKLGQIFGMQTMDGFKAVISEYQTTGKNPMYQFLNVSGTGKELLSDSARAAQEFNAAMQNLNTSWQKFATTNLAGPVKDLANYLNGLQPGTVDRWLKLGVGVTAIVGGMVLLNSAFSTFKNIRSLFGGKVGTAGVGIPVTVTNMPGGGLLGPNMGGKGLSTTGSVIKGAGKVAALLGTGVATASTAAIAGTVIAGAAIGGGIGYAANKYWIKGRIGEFFYDMAHQDFGKPTGSGFGADGKLNGTIKIAIDQTGNARVTEMKSSAKGLNFDLDSGLYATGY